MRQLRHLGPKERFSFFTLIKRRDSHNRFTCLVKLFKANFLSIFGCKRVNFRDFYSLLSLFSAAKNAFSSQHLCDGQGMQIVFKCQMLVVQTSYAVIASQKKTFRFLLPNCIFWEQISDFNEKICQLKTQNIKQSIFGGKVEIVYRFQSFNSARNFICLQFLIRQISRNFEFVNAFQYSKLEKDLNCLHF